MPTLVILAAGIGSRYGGLKQMEPVGPSGEFIIDYAVYDAVRAGFDRVVFVIRPDIEEDFKATVGERISRAAPDVSLGYVFQDLSDVPPGFTVPADRAKPWGTGHATLTAAAAVEQPFAVINADDFYGAEAYRLLADFLRETAGDEAHYAMVGYRLRKTVSDHGYVARGVCATDSEGYLTDVEELTRIEKHADGIRFGERELTGDETVSMNFWGFKCSFFEHLAAEFGHFLSGLDADPAAELFVPTVVNTLIQAEKVRVSVFETSSAWLGVTYREERDTVAAEIRKLIDAGEYPADLWTL